MRGLLVATGMVLVIVSRNIDLSVGSIVALAGVVLAMVAAWRWDRGDQLPNGQRAARELLRALREGPPYPALDAVMRADASKLPTAVGVGPWANCRLATVIWSPRVWSKPTASIGPSSGLPAC